MLPRRKPKAPKHGRTKEKYNPTPTAREKAFHEWAWENFPCGCGCGQPATMAHHLLSNHPLKRWRRDHEVIVPMDGFHHMNLHRCDARAIEREHCMGDYAAMVRERAYEEGVL